MTHSFFLILILVSLILPSLDVSAEAPSPTTAVSIKKSPGFKLTTQGAPQMSMATYGLLVKEVSPSDQNDKRVFNGLVRQTVSNINAAANPPLSQDPILTYLNTTLDATSNFQNRAQGIQTAREANQQFGVTVGGGIALASVSGGPVTGAVGVVAGTAVGLGTLAIDNKLARQLGKLEDEHSSKMSDLVTVALRETQAKNKDLFKQVADGSANAESAKAALDKLVGAQKAILDEGFLDKLPPGPAREQGRTAMVYALRDAVGRAQALNDNEFKKLKLGLSTTQERLTRIEAGFGQIREQTQTKFEALEEAQKRSNKAITELQEGLQGLASQTNQNSQDLNFMQDLMWGKLSNKEKLAAVDHGFMRDLTPQKRAEVREALRKSADAEELMGKVSDAITYVGGTTQLLAGLGVPINQRELTKNLNTAKIATSIVTSYMTGNYIGALMAAGSLFGSDSGPDAGEIRHQQVMAKLDEIKELQKQTLAAVNQLSRQVTLSTEQIMDKLAELDYKMDISLGVSIGVNYDTSKKACVEFQSLAFEEPYLMNDRGQFPSYILRKKHFEKAQSSTGNPFYECTNFLHKVANVSTVMDTNSSHQAHEALSVKILEFKNAKSWQTTHWAPMIAFTHELLGTGQKRYCSSRLLGMASHVPERFSDVSVISLICPADRDIDGSTTGSYLNSRRQLIYGYLALQDALYFPTVRFFGEALAFYAPYYDLMQPAAEHTTRQMLTEEELLRSKVDTLEPTTGERWMSQYIDVINILLAQETIYSGLFVVKNVAENIIEKSAFGDSAVGKDNLYQYWRDRWKALENDPKTYKDDAVQLLRKEWIDNIDNKRFIGDRNGMPRTRCESLKPGYPEGLYFAASCLMEINPFFRQNVVTSLVLRAIERSREQKTTQGTESLYRMAYYLNNPYWMEKLLPGLPVEWRKEGSNEEGWYLKLRKHTGERWYLPLPSPYIVATGTVAYTPVMRQAREYREVITKRYLFHSAHRHVNGNTKLSQPLKKNTLKLMQQMSLYTDDTILAEFLVDKENRPIIIQSQSSNLQIRKN